MRDDDRVDAARAGGPKRGEIGAERGGIDVVEPHPHTGRNGGRDEIDAPVRGEGHRRTRRGR